MLLIVYDINSFARSAVTFYAVLIRKGVSSFNIGIFELRDKNRLMYAQICRIGYERPIGSCFRMTAYG